MHNYHLQCTRGRTTTRYQTRAAQTHAADVYFLPKEAVISLCKNDGKAHGLVTVAWAAYLEVLFRGHPCRHDSEAAHVVDVLHIQLVPAHMWTVLTCLSTCLAIALQLN
jgi:hypothetical protein